jgi:hypothetical protein
MMRMVSIGLLLSMLFMSARAALKRTEDLPSPTRGIEGSGRRGGTDRMTSLHGATGR